MCGIAGVYWYRDGIADSALVARQTRAMRHRGPDDAGLWCEGPAALGHRRLAIHDLSPAGHQPMSNEDRSVWVVFNGEIYNWTTLRAGLVARGHQLRGRSDCEILPHLWEEAGPAVLDELRGMFALAVFDARHRTLMLARDRVGEKPLFYHDDGRRLVFASELKALMLDPTVPRDVEPSSVADMLTFQYVPAPRCIWRGVRKLAPGHRLVCDARGPRVEPYWSLPVEVDRRITLEAAVERLSVLLAESVRIRLASDVPVGAFLSGGVDSSSVVALMAQASPAPIRTFSLGFEDEDLSELCHARTVAHHVGAQHHEVIVRPNALEVLPKLVWALDEPFSDVSMVSTYLIAEAARRHVVVALSGDGGDEVFGGYRTYLKARRHARADGVPRALRRLALGPAALMDSNHRVGRWLRHLGMDVVDRHLEAMSRFEAPELAAILSPDLVRSLNGHDSYAVARLVHDRARRTLGAVPALLALDAQTFMTDDVLVKVDRTSMLNSLEVRAPLLDHRVVEYVARLPFRLKMRGRVTKLALRECVRSLLPPPIVGRGKQGFGLPLERWFGLGLEQLGKEILLDSRCRGRGWLDPRSVSRLLAGDGVRRGRRAHQIFALCCLELWAQTWVDRPRESLGDPLGGCQRLHTSVAARTSAE